MERTINSVFEKEVSTATFNDWNLNFTVERLGGVVQTIQVTGQKNQSYFNANRNESGNTSVSFSGQTGYDNVLAGAVTGEIENIVNPAEEA